MRREDLAALPGVEIVLAGIEDLEAGRETVNSLAVRAAATGLEVEDLVGDLDVEQPAAHRLYLRLSERHSAQRIRF